jgi:NAD(P)-dependent dehydrogenase (short-subunit alcohol dehydrogenase family)
LDIREKTMVQSFLITGANSGCGLEGARQLAVHFASINVLDGSSKTKIYLLCRSEAKARQAITDIGANSINFLLFDANDDSDTIKQNVVDKIPENEVIAGIVLNAGGFGDIPSSLEGQTMKSAEKSNCGHAKKACSIAQANIVGHAILVDQLSKNGKFGPAARIIAVGSEGVLAPGASMDWKNANMEERILGTVRTPNLDYGWIKGILALYWRAFARHHPEVYVLTVSPGAVGSTNLLVQGGSTPTLRLFSRLFMFFLGSHSVQVGAKRYVDALLDRDMPASTSTSNIEEKLPSGSVLLFRKGFTKDYGCIDQLEKGKFVTDTALQDEAFVVVNQFV